MRRLFLAAAVAALLVAALPAVASAHGSEGHWGHAAKVTLCHQASNGSWHTITVGAPAARAHLRHGDTLGACAAGSKPGAPATTCTFSSPSVLYYNDAAKTSLYASGWLRFSWTIATGAFLAPGEWTEVAPPYTGTVYHNVFASGTVTGGAVSLMTATRSDNYPPFAFTGTLSPFAQAGRSASTFTGTAAGGYLTAVGAITCGRWPGGDADD